VLKTDILCAVRAPMLNRSCSSSWSVSFQLDPKVLKNVVSLFNIYKVYYQNSTGAHRTVVLN
jgi:hypothetical protein